MGFHQNIFHALQSLNLQDVGTFQHHALQARLQIINTFKHSQTESCSSVYPIFSQLQILNEVEAALKCVASFNSQSESTLSIEDLELLWDSRDVIGRVSPSHHEPIISARISTLHAFSFLHEQNEVNRALHSLLLKKSRLLRACMRLGTNTGCETALVSAAKLDVVESLNWRTRFEEAEVAKCQGDIQHAARVLRILLKDMTQDMEGADEILLCQVLNLYGSVLMDSRAKPPKIIIEEFFKKSVGKLEQKNYDCGKVLENSYHQLALYGDKLYKEVHQYLESDAIQAKKENIVRSKEELIRVRTILANCADEKERKDLHRKHALLQKNITIDGNVLKDLEKEQEDYLQLALQNYLKCLLTSQKHDLHVYRAVALWLENLNKPHINKMVNDYGVNIKTYKFAPLLYQLVARLTCKNEGQHSFPGVLNSILERVCVDHPHHSLPVVLALSNAHGDDEVQKKSTQHRLQYDQVLEEDRVQAAKLLISRLKKMPLCDHILEMERVWVAYISLANWSDGKERHSPGDVVKIPRNQPIAHIKDIQYTSALTRPLPLQPSGIYEPILIKSWGNTCTYVGGINSPKRLTMTTSDGCSQFELLKGKDDIRQDAVMEQVFGIVNTLLAKNPNTRDKALSMRTYQVIPLSQRSGLIQWCENTQPFGEYLIGRQKKGGAHKLYYPLDYPAVVCRKNMEEAKLESQERKLQVYEDILEHFKPVFRYFFYENYPLAHEWYKRRLNYTRSVATNSMVGYILGLGDRHVENILLDKGTAEVIHIDLGIAFELGKCLPTPETVPFRLTQDVVDGIGVMGIEGPFRQSCEATLQVLRMSSEVLITIVEVLRHDPLYQWTLSPVQIQRLQADEDEVDQGISINSASMADRVVLRVRQKILGLEEGYTLSVAEQVTVLIQQATNNTNLSRLYPGWQPYL
ncbi:hypothetical protein SK128_024144 [Halocaridina rubra]|uniref:non-specific serine/threonine protein kinase n=1 Tax=Halocaridina rubra TaxID=373956 RepID=A0AAN8WMC2_HALRR